MNPRACIATFVLGLFFLTGTQPSEAGVDACQVINLSGKAQVLDSGSGQWRFLVLGDRLKGRERVRTVGKSAVDLSTSNDLSGLLRIGVESEVEIMGEDFTRFFLHRGLLFVLREEEGDLREKKLDKEMLFQILTRDLTASFVQGGCSVAISEEGTWVRVFSEKINLLPFLSGSKKETVQSIGEGYKFFLKKSKGFGGRPPQRMSFAEYTDWKYWMLQCYARKDELARNTLIKG